MSFESQLKETFMKHADDVRPDTQSWPVIEKRVVRRHRAGMFATAASVAALIAVTAIVTPRLVARKPSGFSKHGKPQPTATEPTPVQRGPIAVHVGADQGFQISIPTGWRAGWWEGVYEYEPAGLPSLAKGGDTFAVSVKLVAGPYDRSGISGAKDPTEMTTINDHLALASEYVGSDHTHDAVYQIQWASCLPPSIECSSNFQNNTLVVIVRASTEALWTKYWPDAQNAVRSIDAYDGTHPAHLEPPTNTFGNSDSLTALMTRFLDARVERVNAEAFMSPQAQAAFANTKNCLDLYRSRMTHKPWTSYQSVNRIDLGSGRAKFLVMMMMDRNNGGYIESITVGPAQVAGTMVSAAIASADYSCNLSGD